MLQRNRRCPLVVFLALILPKAVFAFDAQSSRITGIVMDASGGERLARVRVLLDAAARETVTNDVGEFAFEDVAQGDHTLIVETVGYRLHREHVTVTAADSPALMISLIGDAIRITDTVTVTADPFAAAIPSSPSETRLGAAEIRNLSSVLLDDPMRSMSTLPGVTAPDDYHAAFSVRGAPFSRISVYLDDVPIHAPTHTFGGLGDGYSISSLNDQMLGGMTLLSAAPPPAFGGATGAAMAAETRDGSRDTTAVHASIGISDINLLAEGPLTASKRGSWLVAGRRSHLAYVTKELGGNSDEQVVFEDVQGRLTYDLDPKNTISVHVLAGSSKYNSGIPDVDPAFPFRFGPNSVVSSHGTTDVVKANWRTTPGATVVLSTTAAYQHTRDEADSESNGILASSRYSDASGQTALTWFWKPTASFRAGYAAHATAQNGTSFLSLFEDPRWRTQNGYDGDARSQDAYAQQDWTSASGRIRATGGIRWQWNSTVADQQVLPFASSTIQLNGVSKIELGWGRYAQFPEIDMVELARPDVPLSAQRSTHYVAAFERRLDPQTRLRIEVYDREDGKIFDAPSIYPRAGVGRALWPSTRPTWTNAYDGYSRGLELVLQRRSASRLTGWIGYTLGYNRERDVQTNTWFDSDNDIRHSVSLYGSYRLRPSVNLSARFNHASGAPIPGYFSVSDFVTQDTSLTRDRNTSRLPAYDRLDVRLNKSFVRDRWKLTMYVEALNATNHQNYRYMGPGGNYSDQAWVRLGSTAPFLPSVGLSLDF